MAKKPHKIHPKKVKLYKASKINNKFLIKNIVNLNKRKREIKLKVN